MTDEEIKSVVTKYIVGGHESDAGDCLHEMEEFDDIGTDDEFEEAYQRAMVIYRQAKVTVTYD